MPDQQPSVGRIVHYVSHGTPVRANGTQAYTSQCRAAIITAVHDMDPVPEHGVPYVDLCVFNPEGMFFNRDVAQHDGGETPGDPDCPQTQVHGDPFRYCSCGWIEASPKGGSWHWPERV